MVKLRTRGDLSRRAMVGVWGLAAGVVFCGSVGAAPEANANASAGTSAGAPGSAQPAGGSNTTLRGVAAISPTDAWAVGYRGDIFGAPTPLIRHWDGARWKTDTSLHVPSGLGGLRAVTALSATDVWAAGWDMDGAYNGIVAHYDGTSWSVVDAATAPNEIFSSIGGAADDDVWVGADDQPGSHGAFAEHFDGTSWNPITLPSGDFIRSVSVDSVADAWLFGFRGAQQTTVVAHWDGSSLSFVTAPNPGQHQNYFEAAAGSSADRWAVGSYGGKDDLAVGRAGDAVRPLAAHWDGTSWTQVRTPRSPYSMVLAGATAMSSADVWGVGFSGKPGFQKDDYLAEHWDGTAWSIVQTPAPPASRRDAILWAVSGDSPSDVWAVGVNTDHATNLPYAVILHWDGVRWSRG